MPDSCCIPNCSNRRCGKNKNLPFYSIPKGKSPFERRRRELWIKVVDRVDWKDLDYDKISKSKICGAHFVSGR